MAANKGNLIALFMKSHRSREERLKIFDSK
jgi:hypothetical protein